MVQRIALSVFLILALLGALQSTGQGPGEAVEYEIIIDCPGLGDPPYQCPIRAVDGQDAMGDPSIAVDPDLPDYLIIGSLHGTGDRGGPSEKSRQGQAFTTFTSDDHGRRWQDSPFTPPAEGGGSGGYGQHPQVTIDPYGHVFVGSLYAVQGNPSDRFDYVIAAQKFMGIRDIRDNQGGQVGRAGDYNAQYIYSLYDGNEIRQMWFVFNPVTDNMTMVWTEHITPHTQTGTSARVSDVLPAGRSSSLADPLAFQMQVNDTPRSSIGVVWTNTSVSGGYHAAPRDEAIGPCETSTNPVLSEGLIYIGCQVADEGPFPWNPEAEPGRVEMFRMHPDGGTPQYIGSSPIVDGMPKLGVRSDGRLALMTVDVANETLRLSAAYGQYSGNHGRIVWSAVEQYGSEIDDVPAGSELVGANIQDMIYREYSGVLHLILKLNVEYPDVPVQTYSVQPSILKAIVALDEKHGLLDQQWLDIGNIAVRLQDTSLMAQPDSVYDDIADDFLELPPAPYEYNDRNLGDSYQREFFAIGDFGTIIFAEVVEITNLRGPVAVPPPNPPPPPVPAAATSPAAAAGVAGALATTAMIVGAAAANKRKSATKARK